MPVREDAGAIRRIQGHGVARKHTDGATGDGRGHEGVVGLVRGRGAGDVQRQRRDIGRDGRRLDDLVIGRIGPGQGVTSGGHALAVGRHPVREAGDDVGRGDGDRIPREGGDRTAADGGAGVPVVGLVGGRDAGDLDGARGDVQLTGDHRGAGEVRASDDERRDIDAEVVGADAEVTAGAEERISRDDRESHRAVTADHAVVEGVRHAHATEHYKTRGAVVILDTLDVRGRGVAVDDALAGDADEDAIRRDDREVARDVVHRVVLGREAAGREHAGVSTGGVDAGIGTGDRRAAADIGQAVAGQEAAEGDTVEVGGVRDGDELRVAVHQDLEGGLRDVRGDADGLHDGVVGGLGSV